MSASEKFLKYVSFDTQSDEASPSTPSTPKQMVLLKELARELEQMGMQNVECNEYGVVYATLPANTDEPMDAIGFIAHVDTAEEITGKDVKPWIIEKYDGKTIVLNDQYSMDPKAFPDLKKVIGDDLIVTDGTTLLGADDKAGIAIIMQALEEIIASGKLHGKIMAAFTCDEEIGRGADHFDLNKFDVDYAYTIDGEAIDTVDYETFNAAKAVVEIKGKAIHPGNAKDKMINAAAVAVEFASLMPAWMVPEHTEGREGYIHLLEIEGLCEHARLRYIIRDHDMNLFEKKKEIMKDAANTINLRYPGVCTLEITDQYKNMKEYMHGDYRSVKRAFEALEKEGIHADSQPVRGGTDGAVITEMGLNTPNLGTGGGNCHGRFEFVSIDKMNTMVRVLCRLVTEV